MFWICSGIVGGGAGLVSKHRKVHGLAKISTTYATNLAIVTGCYCGNFIFYFFYIQSLSAFICSFKDVLKSHES
jgi:hypothetical protein